ncbi:hypothetical protein TWF281_002056 [Arthrobotrys megalospora]
METPAVFSSGGAVGFLGGKTRRVLRFHLPALATSSDGFPSNIRDPQKSLKPGEKVEWYVRDELAVVNVYRAKLGDLIAEDLGFRGTDDWMVENLPAGFAIFTHQKGTVDDKGRLVIERQDSYLYGHQSGSRYRSPKEFLPHLIGLLRQNEGSLSGHPRNITIPHDPLYTCTCQHCSKKSRLLQTMSAEPLYYIHVVDKQKVIRAKANHLRSMQERGRDFQDGAWRFRQLEVVWVFEAPRKPTDPGELDAPVKLSDPSDPHGVFGAGGRWFAAAVVGTPASLSIEEFAEAFMDDEPTRTHYRVQKCGTDHYVKDFNLKYVLPWVKTPVPDESRGIVIDHLSVEAALGAFTSASVSDRLNIAPAYDGAKIIHEIEGAFFGPEKVWVGDVIRVPKKNPPPNISVWDPASHGLMVVNRLTVGISEQKGDAPDTPKFITIYFTGHLLSTEQTRPLETIPFQIPMYLQNAGTDYGKWIAGADAEGNPLVGTVNTGVVLSRFYDPRIMQIIDTHYQTVDAVIQIDHYDPERGKSMGFNLLNGEPLRRYYPESVWTEVPIYEDDPQDPEESHKRPKLADDPQGPEDRHKRPKLH